MEGRSLTPGTCAVRERPVVVRGSAALLTVGCVLQLGIVHHMKS